MLKVFPVRPGPNDFFFGLHLYLTRGKLFLFPVYSFRAFKKAVDMSLSSRGFANINFWI
jgi:hypothetical protein